MGVILIRARQNERRIMREAELNDLFEKWIQPIYRYTLSRVGNEEDAKDLCSQTFLSAWQNHDRYEEWNQFSAWLFSIARNKIKDYYRQRKRNTKHQQALNNDKIELIATESPNDDILALRQLISQLREKDQDLIHLRYGVGLDFETIAKIIKRKPDALRKACNRLIYHMKEIYEKEIRRG